MIFENISREKAGQLINIAKILSISSLTNFTNRFPSLKKLIKSSNNTNDWDFFVTVGGVAMGTMIIEPKVLAEQFTKEIPLKAEIPLNNKKIALILRNPSKKSWPHYLLKEAIINNRKLKLAKNQKSIILKSGQLNKFLNQPFNTLDITIG